MRNPGSMRRTLTKLPMNNAAPTSRHDGERDLGDDQHGTRATAAAARAAATRAFVERGRERGTGSLQRGSKAGDEARHQRRERRDREHARIDTDRGDTSEALGQRCRQHAYAPPGEGETGDGPGRRHDEALDQHALNQSTAAGAECRPHGRIALLHRRTSEPQVRDVRARDEQHDADRGEEHEHPRTRGGADEMIAERANADAASGVGRAIGRGDGRGDLRHLRLGLVERHIRFQPRDALCPPNERARSRRAARSGGRGAQSIQNSAGCDDPGGYAKPAGMTPTIV